MSADTIAARLEKTYARIQKERMQDMPLLNRKLRVKAVGFRAWDAHSAIGVLITPWFMNLMLVPTDSDAWHDLSVGSKVQHSFPSGLYEFIVGEEARIGRYQMCSLFSPVFEFEDQKAAVATADAVMLQLLAKDNTNNADPVTRAEQVSQDSMAFGDSSDGFDSQRQGLGARTHQPMDRREFLRGLFLRDVPRGGE